MLFGLVVLAAVLARAQTQIVPANLPSTQLCSIPEETVRVLPSSGFSRGVWDSWTATQLQSPAGPDATLAAYANCLFWSFDPSFEGLLGADPVIMQVGPTTPTTYTYTETPAYLPDTNELVFSSVEAQWSAEIGTSAPNNMSRLSLTTGELVPIPISPPPGNLGGASYYKKDGAGMVVVAGLGDANDAANPPAIYLLDPVTGNYTILVNNWFGQRFGGFDDVIAMADGSIIMTDTNFTTGAMPPFSVNLGGAMPYAVWILPGIGGPPRPLIGHTQIPNNPNGLALNEDETVLYVSCSSLTGTMDTNAEAAVNQVFAFDLLERQGGYFAANQRLFAESDYGFVDGFKSDALGNIYGSTSDGVSVWNAAGTLIGKVLIPTTKAIQQHPTSAIGFANSSLVIMHNTGVLLLPLNTTEAAFVAND